METPRYTVAIDLGGTHVRGALVADDGHIVVAKRRKTPTDEPQPTVVPDLIKEVMAEAGDGVVAARAVIGLPGVIDHEAERLVAAPNIPAPWVANLNEQWLSKNCGLDVSLANDADLAAVGEATYGAGRHHRDVVYVTISTGVGAGLVVGNTLVRGTLSGGELGHTIIDRSGAEQDRAATVETLGSGTAIELAAHRAGIEAKGADFADLVRSGHEPAVEIWTTAIKAVGIGIANLAWIVAPQVVVIGGGVGRNHDLVAPILRGQLARYGPASVEAAEITTAALGDDAALAGAAAWWEAVGRGR